MLGTLLAVTLATNAVAQRHDPAYDAYVIDLGTVADGPEFSLPPLMQTGIGEVGVFDFQSGAAIAYMGTDHIGPARYRENVFLHPGETFDPSAEFVLVHTGEAGWGTQDLAAGWENREYLDWKCRYVVNPDPQLSETLDYDSTDIHRWSFVLLQGPNAQNLEVRGYMHREWHHPDFLENDVYYDHYVFSEDYVPVQDGGDSVLILMGVKQHATTAAWFQWINSMTQGQNPSLVVWNYTQFKYGIQTGDDYVPSP